MAIKGISALPKISVIIPMYNVAEKLNQCLKSLQVQTFKNYEVIFVDDCSTDDTIDVIRAWISKQSNKDHKYIIECHDENKGVAAARNTGLRMAKGIYIYYLDADDYIEPDSLLSLYEASENETADIVGCEWLLNFGNFERWIHQPDILDGLDGFKKICKGSLRCNLWLYMAKRSLYEKSNLKFLPSMNMGEDLAMMARLMLSSSKFRIVHKALYHYNQTNCSSISKNYSLYKESLDNNICQIDSFLKNFTRDKSLYDYINVLWLTVKLPLLMTSRHEDYVEWHSWHPEAIKYLHLNDEIPFYTRFIQKAAKFRQYWFIKTYSIMVKKILYGLMFGKIKNLR